jgi:DNA-binding CsgD family transcriptional regulator
LGGGDVRHGLYPCAPLVKRIPSIPSHLSSRDTAGRPPCRKVWANASAAFSASTFPLASFDRTLGDRLGHRRAVDRAEREAEQLRLRRRDPRERDRPVDDADRPGDANRARSLATRAANQAATLGMSPFVDRTKGLRAQLSAAEPEPLRLTRRELEVAELVGQGLTNREIARRLVLSERTAQNHVQHILTKLGLANRSQVAVWVNSRKLSMPAE